MAEWFKVVNNFQTQLKAEDPGSNLHTYSCYTITVNYAKSDQFLLLPAIQLMILPWCAGHTFFTLPVFILLFGHESNRT